MDSAIFSHSETVILTGCSQIGKMHIAFNLPNQDSYALFQNEKVTVVAVADGVGSDKNSEYASKNAVKAVVTTLVNSDGKVFEELAKNIQNTFVEYMNTDAPVPTSGTTCIFCAIFDNHNLVIGQIGDGICCGSVDGKDTIIQLKDAQFTNIVNALTVSSAPDQWYIKEYHNVDEVKLMLTTDGIADDILPGKECQFAHFLIDRVTAEPEVERENYLRNILKTWETPNSNDDKTVVLYHWRRLEVKR